MGDPRAWNSGSVKDLWQQEVRFLVKRALMEGIPARTALILVTKMQGKEMMRLQGLLRQHMMGEACLFVFLVTQRPEVSL